MQQTYKSAYIVRTVYEWLDLAQNEIISLGNNAHEMAYNAHLRDDIKKSQILQDIAARLTIDRITIPDDLKLHRLRVQIWLPPTSKLLPKERRLDNVRYILDEAVMQWSNEGLPGSNEFWIGLINISDAIVSVRFPGAARHSTPRTSAPG